MTDTSHDTSNGWGTRARFILRLIVILGIIVLLFFISIGIVRYVPKLFGGASTYLSTLFGGKPLEVGIDKKEVRSGDGFSLSWKNNTKDNEGQYTFSFKCIDGVKVEYQSTSGLKPVVCATLFPLPSDVSSYPFRASSTSKTNVAVPYTVTLWDKTTNKSKLSATGDIVLIPKDAPYSDAVQNPSQTASVNLYNSDGSSADSNNTDYSDATSDYQNSNNSSNANSNSSSNSNQNSTNSGTTYTNTKTYGNSPNIGISLVQVGYVDNAANYYGSTSIPENARVLVRFRVSNIGDAPTGTWSLTANLPTKIYAERTFTSGGKSSILPGNSFEMTLAFDSFDPNIGSIGLNVQSTSDISSSNNYLSIPVNGNGYYDGNNGGGNHNSGDADLVVRITDVQYLANNYYGSYGYYSDRVIVNFEVTNIGGESTGSWDFKAELPGNDDYNSSWQNSLAPGQKTTFTLGFDRDSNDSDYIRITVDDDDNVDEENENNNSDSQRI